MEELKTKVVFAMPALPRAPKLMKSRKSPLLADAAAFAVLLGGGYAALWIMELLFRLVGVA